MNSSPFVSLILPIRNEAASLEAGLLAIMAQDYPAERMEILIAEGRSDDGTRALVESFAARHPAPEIRILDNPGKIVPTGMNIALRQAKGEIILRVDGHTTIAPDYVCCCVEALERSGAENVGGRMNAVGNTPFGRAAAQATSTPFGVGGARFHYSEKEEWVDTVYMGAWPRRVFEQIGLFDEELVRNQDDEFNYRLRKHGGRILLSPTILSMYTVRGTPRALAKQYFQYGFWKVRVLQKHPRQMSLRQFVPPAFVLALLLGMLAALLGSWSLLALVAGAYLLANIGASLWTALRCGWRSFMFLPRVFTIIHISYGLGFLTGLGRFLRRWGDKKGKTPPL